MRFAFILLLGVLFAAGLGFAAHLIARDTVALPVASIEAGERLAPVREPAPRRPARTTTTERTTTAAETTTTTLRTETDDSGRGRGRGRGRGGDSGSNNSGSGSDSSGRGGGDD